jgi:uncharacterized protein (DUF362 family)
MNEERKMDRRDFLKTGAALGAVAAGGFLVSKTRPVMAQQTGKGAPDLVAVRNGDPEQMFDRGMAAYGGMKRFVHRGDTVVIKPNMSWNREPEMAANTNPKLVKRIVEHCFEAGARKVYVFDHTLSYWKSTYKNSGIEPAASEAGANVISANSSRYYQKVRVPGGKVLKEVAVHELVLDCDVFINVPILKDHSSTQLTMAMKNLMGVVWDRSWYHRNGLHQCIADFCHVRKPDLNVLDAYRIMLRGGPGYASREDIQLRKNLLLSTDIVAIDSAGAQIHENNPQNIGFITDAYRMNLGNMYLDQLSIEKIVL